MGDLGGAASGRPGHTSAGQGGTGQEAVPECIIQTPPGMHTPCTGSHPRGGGVHRPAPDESC